MAINMVVVCDVCGDTGWSVEIPRPFVADGVVIRIYRAAVDALTKPMNGRQWKRVGDKLCCSIRCASDAWEPPRCSCERPIDPSEDRRGDGVKCLVCEGSLGDPRNLALRVGTVTVPGYVRQVRSPMSNGPYGLAVRLLYIQPYPTWALGDKVQVSALGKHWDGDYTVIGLRESDGMLQIQRAVEPVEPNPEGHNG